MDTYFQGWSGGCTHALLPASPHMSLVSNVVHLARCNVNSDATRLIKSSSRQRTRSSSVRPHVRYMRPFLARTYTTIHPPHKPIVHLPTKDEEEREKPVRPERAINLIGLTRPEMEEEFVHFGLPKFRATQIFQWIYGQGAQSFEEMPNLGKQLTAKLKEHYYIDLGSTSADSTSEDGTRKWLVDLGNKQCVESA